MSDLFHDVTLFVGDRSIDAHQEVLRKASRFFAKAFDKYNSRGRKLVLPMLGVEVNYEELLDVIKFIYAGKFSADRQDASLLLALFDLKFQLHLETLTGKIVNLDGYLSDTVLAMKNNLFYEEGIPPCQSRLIYRGVLMEDERTLKSYGIATDSTISLVLRLGGSCGNCRAHGLYR